MFFRCKRPCFRGSEGPVHERLIPIELLRFIEIFQERAPDRKPEIRAFPLAEPPPAGHVRRVSVGQSAPAGPAAEHTERMPFISRPARREGPFLSNDRTVV